MGKKGGAGAGGGNSKKEQGRARKEEKKVGQEREKAAQVAAAEDAEWQKGSNTKGAAKKEAEERKRQEKEAKRAELKALTETDSASTAAIKSVKRKPAGKKKGVPDVPDFIRGEAKKAAARQKAVEEKSVEYKEVEVFEASGIDGALDALAVSGASRQRPAAAERHPERRQKAAYAAWEERMMPQLREENPGLKRSQLKERLFDMWKKSPDNPMNQAHVAYNETVQKN